MALPPLTDTDLAILDIERTWRLDGRPKAELVDERLGFSRGEYHEHLAALSTDPAALAHDPLVVHRIRREVDSRRAHRRHGPVLRGLVPHLDPA